MTTQAAHPLRLYRAATAQTVVTCLSIKQLRSYRTILRLILESEKTSVISVFCSERCWKGKWNMLIGKKEIVRSKQCLTG